MTETAWRNIELLGRQKNRCMYKWLTCAERAKKLEARIVQLQSVLNYNIGRAHSIAENDRDEIGRKIANEIVNSLSVALAKLTAE